MKRIIWGLIGSIALLLPALPAQSAGTTATGGVVVSVCGTPTSTAPVGQVTTLAVDTTGALCTGGTGSGGGAVTIADGADVTQGHIADATVASGASGTIASYLRTIKDAAVSTTPTPVRITASAADGATPSHAIVANNTTSVAVDASPGTVYSVQVFNNSATIAYLKLYDASQGSTTCGSGTPKKVIMIPASTSGAGAVINVGGAAGVAFATAITRCVTTGIADNDATAPAASTYLVEIDYK